MEFIYQDSSILVCVKPAGVLSTDEPGGMPELARAALGEPQGCVRTVPPAGPGGERAHGPGQDPRRPLLSSPARSGSNASKRNTWLSSTAAPRRRKAPCRDLLRRDKAERKTYVTEVPGKDVQEAILSYRLLGSCNGLSQVHIRLQTGRTHQIRAQFSARGLPLVGDRKYSLLDDGCPIALWSHCLRFCHPVSGKPMTFRLEPPPIFPWTLFCD